MTARWIGRYLIAVAAVHTVAAVVFHGAALAAIASAGFLRTVAARGDDGGRSLALWFLIAGLMLALVGILVDAIEAGDRPLPRGFGVALLALALAGIAVVPLLGFWLLLPPAVAVIARGRRHGGAGTRA